MNYDKYNLLMHLESRPCSGEEALASTGVISWNQVINNLTNKDAHLKKYLYFFSSSERKGDLSCLLVSIRPFLLDLLYIATLSI